ncbi:RING-H2 finger protein ATL52-like [Cynara cardunculus var. scolymus]|uniref:RING-type E3 ubiquitin transferase n=1 Tax=Cynara cardunculus var. scolymus TaxID=59895 RepID=A0A118JZI4_CYNCS|nr:RING-H2 finger protein ATL52-like [Cynara cardunculus var. scolymus]KVH99941.1 Zinc finger, RING/FYVE/PHD-type [Cynara cardunculus var. scolymus]
MAMEEISSSTSQTLSTNSFFTPLLISIMGIGATALAILMYHLLVVRYCMRTHAARMASLQAFAGAGVPTGVDEKTLLNIPIITYIKTDSNSDQCECAVCLGDVENRDQVRLLPNCKHVFHVSCIDEWFVAHTSCPVCRVSVVAPDDEVRNCPICRSSVGASSDDRSVGSGPEQECDDQTDATIEVSDGDRNADGSVDESASGPRMVLRHCNSLVLPRETKGRLSGMELKRSLSMGESSCVTIDIHVDNNVGRDCSYYFSFRDEPVKRFQRVSSKVKQSISRMCVEQGSGILPY